MVEFTLVLPLLVGLFLGTILFGRNIHTYNRLEESVRAGARFASGLDYDAYVDSYHSGPDPAPTQCASCRFTPASGAFVTSVKNIVAYGCDPAGGSGTGCTQVPVVEGVSPANVTVTLQIVNRVPRAVEVSINGVRMNTPTGAVVLNGKPVTTFPYVGFYRPPKPA
jgi:hypothetical protein